MPVRFLLTLALLTATLTAHAQVLTVINEDSTQTRRFRPGQFLECNVQYRQQTVTVRGRLAVLYPAAFMLEISPKQWATIPLADLVSVRRIRRGWAELLADSSLPATSLMDATTGPITVADVIPPALAAAGAVALTGPQRAKPHRYSIYRGWQFGVQPR
jgi:hypothetical protein